MAVMSEASDLARLGGLLDRDGDRDRLRLAAAALALFGILPAMRD